MNRPALAPLCPNLTFARQPKRAYAGKENCEPVKRTCTRQPDFIAHRDATEARAAYEPVFYLDESGGVEQNGSTGIAELGAQSLFDFDSFEGELDFAHQGLSPVWHSLDTEDDGIGMFGAGASAVSQPNLTCKGDIVDFGDTVSGYAGVGHGTDEGLEFALMGMGSHAAHHIPVSGFGVEPRDSTLGHGLVHTGRNYACDVAIDGSDMFPADAAVATPTRTLPLHVNETSEFQAQWNGIGLYQNDTGNIKDSLINALFRQDCSEEDIQAILAVADLPTPATLLRNLGYVVKHVKRARQYEVDYNAVTADTDKHGQNSTEKRSTNSSRFWKRFTQIADSRGNVRRLTRISDFALPEVLQNLTRHKYCATDLLSCIQPIEAQPGSYVSPCSLRTCFTNMQQLAQNDAASAVADIVYKIYFWIVTCDIPARYVVEAQAERCTKVRRIMIDNLWAEYQESQPDINISYEHFDQKVRDWRLHGCRYVWLASRLNLGSLLHLQSTIRGAKDAFTRGGEKTLDKHKASEMAVAHLQSIGLCEAANRSGANELMHSMLWLVCEGINGFSEERAKRGYNQRVKFVGLA